LRKHLTPRKLSIADYRLRIVADCAAFLRSAEGQALGECRAVHAFCARAEGRYPIRVTPTLFYRWRRAASLRRSLQPKIHRTDPHAAAVRFYWQQRNRGASIVESWRQTRRLARRRGWRWFRSLGALRDFDKRHRGERLQAQRIVPRLSAAVLRKVLAGCRPRERRVALARLSVLRALQRFIDRGELRRTSAWAAIRAFVQARDGRFIARVDGARLFIRLCAKTVDHWWRWLRRGEFKALRRFQGDRGRGRKWRRLNAA
jgi:hypothetical protein